MDAPAADHDSARILVAYIASLPDWQIVDSASGYEQMGAIICDAGLQAGVNYLRVVAPRVARFIREYPNARTTSDFLRLVHTHGAGTVLRWTGMKKLNTVVGLALFFADRGVETIDQLKVWVAAPDNREALSGVKGVGPKTIDYIQILAGIPAVAVDVHLQNFVRQAGIVAESYRAVRAIVSGAADLMHVNRSDLDRSIWAYMSGSKSAAEISKPSLPGDRNLPAPSQA